MERSSEPVADTAPPHVWVVRAGKGGRYANDFEQLGLVAVGFAPIADIRGMDRDVLFDHARALIGSKGGAVAGQLHRFANVARPGDLVIVPDGGTRELLYGKVTGDYEYRADAPVADFKHVRKVEWLGRRNRDELPDRALFSIGCLQTEFEPSSQEVLASFLLTGVVPEQPEEDVPVSKDNGGDSTSAAEQGARNQELIGKQIAQLGWAETQDLVAGILRALDYKTDVAPAGPDGGVDIRACRDPLFLHPPIIKVQVKAKPTTRISPDEIRQLNGLVDHASQRGIFVATGGFTAPAQAEAEQMGIQLWDLERLGELFLETYGVLDEVTQELVPLRRIWVLDDRNEDEEAPAPDKPMP